MNKQNWYKLKYGISQKSGTFTRIYIPFSRARIIKLLKKKTFGKWIGLFLWPKAQLSIFGWICERPGVQFGIQIDPTFRIYRHILHHWTSLAIWNVQTLQCHLLNYFYWKFTQKKTVTSNMFMLNFLFLLLNYWISISSDCFYPFISILIRSFMRGRSRHYYSFIHICICLAIYRNCFII